MDESRVAFVAEQMRRLGLEHDVFDPEETAADLEERSTLNHTLDELLTNAAVEPVPTTFDPGWQK